MSVKTYVYNALVGFDAFSNTVLGGHPDETISARAGRAAAQGKTWGKTLSTALGWLEPNHCKLAEVGDLNRAEAVEQIEEKATRGN